jgi:hypothetical protein
VSVQALHLRPNAPLVKLTTQYVSRRTLLARIFGLHGHCESSHCKQAVAELRPSEYRATLKCCAVAIDARTKTRSFERLTTVESLRAQFRRSHSVHKRGMLRSQVA